MRESKVWHGFFRSGIAVLTGFLLSFAAGGRPALADPAPAARVVRLTYTQGYVHVDRHDGTAGDPAQLNMPLTEGQALISGEDGQAEIEFEDGSVARLTPNSTLTLAHLSADPGGSFNTQIGLMKGLAYFELRAAPKFTYSVSAAGDLITPTENTSIRVNLDEAPAAIAVLLGAAHVERLDNYKVDVHAGETFRSDISNAGRYFLTQEIAGDTWDQWNEARDQAAADAAPRQTTARDGYAGSQGYGWSDLDANGSWYNVPGQGQVWQPDGGDQADFDPYGNGSWMWYPGGGYLWASAYPWGWTPFRCGGWSYWNTFGWGWSPNGGCAGLGFAGYGGFGFGGYGGYINIILPPPHYRLPRPTGGTGPGVHPIITMHNGGGGLRPIAPVAGSTQAGLRRIGGVTATPLRPIGAAYTPRGGSAVGASLTRDFPVDRATHAAVLGTPPAHTGFITSIGRDGEQVGGTQSGVHSGAQPGMRPYTQQPGVSPSSQSYSGNAYHSPTQYSHPVQSQQAAPHYAPPPQVPRQSYSAPAAPASHSAPSAPSGGGGKH